MEFVYLYRGASADLHSEAAGRLMPKRQGSFEHMFACGEGIICGDGSVCGSTETNAVIRHQLNQEGYPTTGVSMTPHFERAKFYALGGGKHSTGYVHKIDRNRLHEFGVREYVVSEYAKFPSVPEDDEVILVAEDNGEIPGGLVIERIQVGKPI